MPPPPPPPSSMTKATGEQPPAKTGGGAGGNDNISQRGEAMVLQPVPEPGPDSRLVSLRKGLRKIDGCVHNSLPSADFIDLLLRKHITIAGDENDEVDEKGSENECEWNESED